MSDYTNTLTDRINALETDSEWGTMVSKDQVLSLVENAVPVEIDLEMFPDGASKSPEDQRILAVVSAVYYLMATIAGERADASVRKEADSLGVVLRPLGEVFAQNRESGYGATSFRELVPNTFAAVDGIGQIMDHLIAETTQEALDGFRMSQDVLNGDVEALAKLLGIEIAGGVGE